MKVDKNKILKKIPSINIIRKKQNITPDNNITLIDLFENSVKKYAEKPFLWERDSRYRSITYKKGRELVFKAGGGFIALGLKPGDRAALLSEGCNAWIIGELGMLYAGGVNVPLSVKLTESSDLLFRLNHSEARFIMVSISQIGKIRAIREKLETVEKVIVIGSKKEDLQDGEMSLNEFYAIGVNKEDGKLDVKVKKSENKLTLDVFTNKKELKNFAKMAEKINTLEPKFESMRDKEVKNMTSEFK